MKKKKMKIRGYATNKSTFVYFLNEQVVNEVIARNMRATSFTKMWADNYRVTFCFDTPWVVVCLFYTDHWHFLTLIFFCHFKILFFTKHTIFIQCINVRTEIYVYLDLARWRVDTDRQWKIRKVLQHIGLFFATNLLD